MKGGGFLPLFAAALVPLLVVGLVVSGSFLGLVQWRPSVLWTEQFGAADLNLNSRVTDVVADSQGIYEVGYLNQNLSSVVGTVSVAKYDFNGAISWTRNVSVAQAGLPSIAVGTDGLYEAGHDIKNITLSKYDFAGNYLWSQRLQSSESPRISATPSGVYLAANSGLLLFVSQYGPQGTLVWTNEFSNTTRGPGFIVGIYVGGSSVFVLTDGPLLGFSLSGTQLWSFPLGINLLITTYSISGDGTDAYVSGTASSSPLAASRGFLTKYDTNGSMVWNRVFESPDRSGVGSSDVWTDSSGIYLAFRSGELNYFVMKYDFNGNQQWIFKAPIASGFGIVGSSASGGFVLAGSFGPRTNLAIIQEYSGTSSLILFGINPPFSFLILGGMLGGAAVCLILFRRLQIKRKRPPRVGRAAQTLPATD